MKLRLVLCAALLTAAATLTIAFDSDDQPVVLMKPPFDASIHGKGAKTGSTQMIYHNGPVMNGANSVYVIYYGTFPSATTQPIINDFLKVLTGTPAYGVNNSYNVPGVANSGVPTSYTFTPPSGGNNPDGFVYYDNGSQGTSLRGGAIPAIVAHAIGAGLPSDQNGVYLVVTSPDVKISGFCTSYCAYHSTSTAIVTGKHIRYALIPDPTQRCSACNGGIAVFGDTATPNGDMGADTMTDDIMHELSETVTDPDLNAWYTKSGAENGDLCNYVYGNTFGDTATGHYNFTVGTHKYLIQLIWANVGAGSCAAHL